jgi:hypothetical protein
MKRQKLKREMNALVQPTSGMLSDKDREIINDLIQNYEYSVALEWFCSAVTSNGLQLSPEQRAEVRRLVRVMKIDLTEFGID